ncbi:helix-turn-helix transcriptional regulator [Pseudochryseolinea flava]|uniref:AraC family transcriptional regulator n=1 Tax=Pseudochryseolinea flava TaxID=2059302 RepID=A0A364XZJ1_9BACT|nr:AraC family transcriptional regulator [Pseudochryseolinea flava]RAV99971.1 AraC family transcriptional regulator [Pseudochryseolinea flava]
MVIDYKKIELYGKPLMQKVVLKTPFEFEFPVSDYACFLFSLQGEMYFHIDDDQVIVPTNYSLFLNCFDNGKKITNSNAEARNELVVISFHPDILKKIYEKDPPFILQQPINRISNQSSEKINNDFLIQKYIEGLLFYFENPSLVNDEILILKLKEIVLLLSQTRNASIIQTILSQLFSPVAYTFKQVIEAHIFSPVSIDDLARKTNLSVSSFKREFAKHYDDSPANYIKNKRLERAAELLFATDNRITDIAFECGFNDLANFTKSFHDKYNVAPSSYRGKNER